MFHYKKKIIKRIIIYLIVFLLFIIIDFLVIAWALGYRWDSFNHQFTKTGAIMLSVNQPNYSLFINNRKIINHKNKIVIKNLLPRDYLIKIEKENYYPWEKNLSVEPHKITYLDKIILFPNNNHPYEIIPQIDDYKIDLEKNNIFVFKKNEDKIIQFSLLEGKIINQIKQESIENFFPSFDGKKILIIQKDPLNKILIIDTQKEKKPLELPIDKTNLKKIEWSLKDNKLFLIYGDNFYEINTGEEILKLNLLAKSIKDFTLSKNYLFYWQKDLDSPNDNLWQSDYSFKEKNIILQFLLKGNELIFPSPDGEKIIFKNNEGEIYLVQDKKLKKITNKAEIIKWNKNNQKLIYSTDFEINLLEFNGNNYEQKLINRFTEKIEYVDWLPYDNHLLFATNKKIKVSELDGKNIITLTEYQEKPEIISVNENFQKEQIKLFFLKKNKDNHYFNLLSLKII